MIGPRLLAPSGSLRAYLGELLARLAQMPPQDARRGPLITRIRTLEAELELRGPHA